MYPPWPFTELQEPLIDLPWPSMTLHRPLMTSHWTARTSHDFLIFWSFYYYFFLKISLLEMFIAFGNEHLKNNPHILEELRQHCAKFHDFSMKIHGETRVQSWTFLALFFRKRIVQCSKSFIDAGTLKRHLLTHSGEKAHNCLQRSKSFNQAGDLEIRLLTHSGVKLHNLFLKRKTWILPV